MRFTVVWHQSAQDELAYIWLGAVEKSAVTRAANEIDRLLRFNAMAHGTEFEGRRVLGVTPLAVAFTVDVENRLVRVNQVWRDSTAN